MSLETEEQVIQNSPTDLIRSLGLYPFSFRRLAARHFHKGRGGRAKLAISTSIVSRMITTTTSLLVLPITITYLGNEGYGLMVTISSVVGWLQFTSLGIGLGLQNALTEETAKGNSDAEAELISTAVFSLAGIGLLLLIAGALAFPFVNLAEIFRPETPRFAHELPASVAIVFVGFVSSIVLGFLSPIYAARQELHIGSIQTVAIAILSMLATLAAVHFNLGLIGIVGASVGLTALLQWSFAIWTLYGRGIVVARPRLSRITRSAWRRMYRTGLSFLALQICNVVFYGADAFLITHFLSVDQVTPYSVAQKVFMQTAGIFAIISGSLWAAYGNARAVGDVAWIRRTHRRMIYLFFLFFGGLSAFMITAGHWLLTLWVGAAAAPSILLIGAVAAYFCVREWTGFHSLLLNGLDVVRPQVWNAVLTAFTALVLEILLIRPYGAIGLAMGGFIAFSSIAAWYFTCLARSAIDRLDSRREFPRANAI